MSIAERPTAAAPPVPRTRPLSSTAATVLAVLRHGLRDQRRTMFTWGLSMGLYGAFMAAIFPSIRTTISDVADKYPSGLMEAFGADDMSTVEGYIHAEMFSLIVPLALALFAARSIMRMIVTAEERGDLDVILSLPLSRRALVTAAAVTTWLTTAGILLLTGVITWLTAGVSGAGLSAGAMAAGAAGVLPLAAFAAGVAAVAGGLTSRGSTVTAVAMGTIVAMYAIDLAGRLVDSLDPLRYASVFRWYGAPLTDGLDVPAFAGLLLVAAALTAVGAALLDRRDLR